MDDPIKLIYKYKNNKRRVQYQIYIFVGTLLDQSVVKVLKKIQDLNFFDTLISLTPKELQIISDFYGDKWYLKFFISYHITNSIQNINSNAQMKNSIIDKFGKEWYENHIEKFKYLDRAMYSYQSIIKFDKELKTKYKRIEFDVEEDYNYQTIESEQIGGVFDEDEDNEEIIPSENILDEIEDNEFDIEELENAVKIDTTNIDIDPSKIKDVIEEVIVDKKIKMIPFDDSKDNKPYDELLKNVYVKNFIFNDYIFWDDTIKTIKYRICNNIEFSKLFNKNSPYLIPSRMYLWSEYDLQETGKNTTTREKLMLGQKWISRTELLKIDIEPNNNLSIYENIKGNLKYLKDKMRKYGSRIKHEDDEYNILEEYRDYINNNEIYMIDIYHELGLNYKSDAEQMRNLYDVYIKIYFNDITNEDFSHIIEYLNKEDQKLELNKIYLTYQNIHNTLLLENESINTIEELKYKPELYQNNFRENYITQSDIIINLNFTSKLGYTKLDLYRIFDNFILNEDYPFIQYQTHQGKLVFKFFEYFDKNIINNKWFENAPYDISFKVKLVHKNETRFISVNLNENGRIEYKTQWKEDDHITLTDVKNTYEIIRTLINKINSENDKLKIGIPHDNQFKYAFINTIQQFYLPNKFIINHNDLSNFARCFYPYITVVVEPHKRQSKTLITDAKSKYGTYLRFKRISKYENEARIDHRIIHFLRNYEYNQTILSNEISKQFNITEKQALEKIESVRQRYPVLKKTRKILKKLENIPKYKPPGIGIDIQGKTPDNYKIRISGARSKEQLERINKFMYILIYLYIDTYLYKNKDRIKLLDKLKSLTNIAKRRNMVVDVYKPVDETKTIKQITKLDKERVGFKPEKGQNQWSRSCQNSGNVNRRPLPFTDDNISLLVKKGYKLNKETGDYEKKITLKNKKDVIIKAYKLDDGKGGNIYWSCDPDENKEYMYVGFLSRSNNPSGLCMPCCFKKDPGLSKNQQKRDYHLKCIGKKKDGVNKLTIGDKLYILQETNKMLPTRFGYLPQLLNNYFNITQNKTITIKNHYLDKTNGYFLKYGSNQDINPYINAIGSCYDLSSEQILNNIITILNKDDIYANQLFTSLNNGDIKTQFKNIKSYIFSLSNNNNIEPILIDDIITLPNILSEKGINIYVLEKIDNNDYHIICKNYENIIYYNDLTRDNIIILKEDNNYYPIYYVKKKENEKKINLLTKYNYNDDIIKILHEYFKISCELISLTGEELPIAKIFYKLFNDKYEIINQIIDTRNKCKFIVINIDNKHLLCPVKPSGSLSNLPFSISYDKYLNSPIDTIKLISNIPIYKPLGFIYTSISNDKYNIVALKINEYTYIPLIPSEMKKENIDELMKSISVTNYTLQPRTLFETIDDFILNNSIYNDNRVIETSKYKYNSETYMLFRLEFSNFLNKNTKIKNKIIKLLEENNISRKDIINNIKLYLYEILNTNLYNKLKTGGGNSNIELFYTIIDKIPETINYQIKNQRNICELLDKNTCNKNIHCTFNDKKCKLAITEDNLIIAINKIVNELVYDEAKQKELLNIDGYYVSDIKSEDVFTEKENVKIIKSDNNNINFILENIFGKNNIPIIGKRRLKKIEKALYQEINEYPLIKIGKTLYQQVINEYAIIRAYTNSYYWLKNKLALINIRNLGYLSPLQSNIVNYFKSLIFDWIKDNNINDIIKVDDDYIDRLENPNKIYLQGIIELYILNQYHKIPILIYDQYDSIIIMINNGIYYNNFKEDFDEVIKIKYNIINIDNTTKNISKVFAIYTED